MSYPSDLNEKQWQWIEPYLKRSDPRGCKGKHDKRIIINAILYVLKGGIQWRMLPKEFPPWQSVYDHYRRWSKNGIFQQILDKLNELSRQQKGRKAIPSYAIIDSQSVPTIYKSDQRGFDGGKKNKRTKTPYSSRYPGPPTSYPGACS